MKVYYSCLIDENNNFIDATWNSSLQKFGFPVNLDWDGKQSLKLGVIPCDDIIIIHNSFQEKQECKHKKIKEIKSEKRKVFNFYKELNKWLNS